MRFVCKIKINREDQKVSVKFEQSKTAENLARAFAGECQDGAKYQYVADMATQQKFPTIATILKQIATNEMAHAKAFMDILAKNASGVIESIKITADYPFQVGNLEQMLSFEEQNENKQAVEVYPEFARIATAEGFEDCADLFMRVAQVEACHTNQLHQLHQNFKEKTLFKCEKGKKFKCSNCGHEAELKSAWKTCPLCGQPQGYVMIEISNAKSDTVLPPEKSWKALEEAHKEKQKKQSRLNSK